MLKNQRQGLDDWVKDFLFIYIYITLKIIFYIYYNMNTNLLDWNNDILNVISDYIIKDNFEREIAELKKEIKEKYLNLLMEILKY